MARLKYKAREGFPFTDEQADLFGRAVDALEASGIPITAHNVLDHIQGDDGLREALGYQWDLRKAAEVHWLEHTRKLLRCYTPVSFKFVPAPKAMHSVSVDVSEDESRREWKSVSYIKKHTPEMLQVSQGLHKRLLAIRSTAQSLGLDKADGFWADVCDLLDREPMAV